MTSLVENLARIKSTFDDIKNAIISKGGEPGATVDTYAEAIDDLVVGGVDVSDTTAVAGDVKAGQKFHTADGNLVDGTFEGQIKTVTPDIIENNVFPDDGKYLSRVTVEAITQGSLDDITWNENVASVTVQKEGWIPDVAARSTTITKYSGSDEIKAKFAEVTTLFSSKDRVYFPSGLKVEAITTSIDAASVLKGSQAIVYSGGTAIKTVNGSAKRCAQGTVTTTSGTEKTVTLGWKPSYVMVFRNRSSSNTMANMYYNGTYLNISTAASSATSNTLITVTSTGFTISGHGTYYGTCYYMAIE